MTAPDPAAPLLEQQTPAVRELLQQLRAMVSEAVPQVSEHVHMGWGVIQYQVGPRMRDMILALVPHGSYVNLQFADGVDLPDPNHRLEGAGKRLRHVKIRSAEWVRHPDVLALVRAQAGMRGS